MKTLLSVMLLMLSTLTLAAQEWGNLDALVLGNLTASGQAEASFWLPDHGNPAQATRALGVAYEAIPGAAGNTGISVGYFVKAGNGWVFAGQVSDIFGHNPRDVLFGAEHIDVTTTMLGPGEPRCCPTMTVRWRIELSRMAAHRLP